ncbi:sensor histidine kinase [Costertonia aggregata]|uniref:Histidine kinase n=1 Tax=Costertonia aggregata TaxID=343403 RepID=A0A7H9APQ6_9FLAO|nr:histidine kinase [Costertonia aggregata]QLG45373.1 histidine kinase [Costertonia aggregata]
MNRILLHFLLWTVYFTMSTVLKANNLDFWYALRHTLAMAPILILHYYAYGHLAVNQYLEKKKYVYFFVTSIIFFIFFFSVKMYFVVPDFEKYYALIPGSAANKEARVVSVTLMLAMLVSTIFHILENRIERDKRTQLLLNEHNEAQLMYLKAQINPHFLFNALNNIYSLTVVKSDKAPKMVLNLADLLRYSIYEGQKEKVFINDEIRHIKKYLELYRSTQEKPITIEFEVLGDISNQKIEPMMLLPIVENCIKHGDFATNPEAYAKIILEVRDNGLRFTTINSTSKANVQKDTVGGVGLENIKKRLGLKYPNRHTFSVMDNGNEFEVLLNIQKLENL